MQKEITTIGTCDTCKITTQIDDHLDLCKNCFKKHYDEIYIGLYEQGDISKETLDNQIDPYGYDYDGGYEYHLMEMADNL